MVVARKFFVVVIIVCCSVSLHGLQWEQKRDTRRVLEMESLIPHFGIVSDSFVSFLPVV